ncbi:MAG TPA: effector-associated domain EAD1-containing protein [Nocardioidaceae bacterium]|nr:effector-associated domain EAD1-containing protein [Nocardioidaceae bacterium]
MPAANLDALVVTALQLERRAVRAHLEGVRGDNREGLAADRGAFRAGSRAYDIAVIETGAGNIDAAILATRAEEAFRPGMVVMLGIAGGLKDVAIGDVVAASKVYWIEGGKQRAELSPRPDFAETSPSLKQAARAVAAGDAWRRRAAATGGGVWAATGREPAALVAPIVVGEKVLADRESDVARLARDGYGDAVAVAMEDVGALRGGRAAERARTLAIRGVSDLVDAKDAADAAGSQPLAAANAAAFLFEVLALDTRSNATTVRHVGTRDLAELGARLYPEGPQQSDLWERAGGDTSLLRTSATGQAGWWHAAALLERGGGGAEISVDTLLAVIADDFPRNDDVRRLTGSHVTPDGDAPDTSLPVSAEYRLVSAGIGWCCHGQPVLRLVL